VRTYRKKGFTNLNGSFILVEKPDNISMGYAPLTLWVSSKCGWLEISPSAEYRSMYESIMHVIGLYFCVIVHAEDLATDGEGESHSVSQEIQDIMMTVRFTSPNPENFW
jgi:hypothetical protein